MKKYISSAEMSSGYSLILVFFASVITTSFYTLFNLKKVFYSELLIGLNVNNTEFGMLMSIYGIACVVTYLPGGFIGDRVPLRYLTGLSLLLVSFLEAALIFVSAYEFLCIIFFLYGIVAGMLFWGTRYKLIYLASIKAQNYGRNIGWSYFFYTGCGMVAVSLLSLLISKVKPEDPFLWMMSVTAILNFILGLCCFWIIPHFEGENSFYRISVKNMFIVFSQMDQKKEVLIAAVIMFLIYTIYSLQYVTTVYLRESFIVPFAVLSIVAAIRSYIVNLFSAPVFGILSARFHISKVLLFACAVILCIMLALALLPAETEMLVWVVFFIVVFGFISGGAYGVTSSLLAELKVKGNSFATASGIFSFIGFLPDMILPFFVGVVLDEFVEGAYRIIFISLGFCAFLAGIFVYFFSKRLKSY